jgi:thiol peroxidase
LCAIECCDILFLEKTKEITKMKITFAGNEMNVLGNQYQVGDIAENFTALNGSLQPVSLNDFEGVKVLNIVPSIDTGVCDAQTRKFNQELNGVEGVDVITISNDLPFAQARWCGAAGLDNITILSDYKDNDFSTKFGTLIDELRLQMRAVLVLDKENKVILTDYVNEVTDHPKYEETIEFIKGL